MMYFGLDAYKYIQEGMTIKFYMGDPAHRSIMEANQGTITRIIPCDLFEDHCRPCRFQIGIDGLKPDCFRYGKDRCGIIYIIYPFHDFITSDEYSI